MGDSPVGLLRLDHVTKVYAGTAEPITALADVSFGLESGEFVTVTGKSGSGKSTLLHVAAGMDRPDAGCVTFDGLDVYGMPERRRLQLRRTELGFVHQFFNLLAPLSALENVALPRVLAGVHPRVAREDAVALLDRIGLGHRLDHKPAELSGGQQQRVAIARSLVHAPRVVLADEPTGNLDTQSGREVLSLLMQMSRERDVAVLLVTHDVAAVTRADRQIAITDGHILAGVGNA